MLRALNIVLLSLLAVAFATSLWARPAPAAGAVNGNGAAAAASAAGSPAGPAQPAGTQSPAQAGPAAPAATAASATRQAPAARADVDLSPQVTVRVLARSEVPGDEFTLEDVADLNGEDAGLVRRLAKISLGRSPQPGHTFHLSGPYIRSRLEPVVSDDQVKLVMPPDAEVVRASQVISGDEIAQQILSQTAQQAGAAGGDVEQQLVSPIQDAVLPTGQVSWDVQPLGHYLSIGGTRTYRVVASIGGHEVWRTITRVQQQVYRKVVIAAHSLSKNQVIRPQDVQRVRKLVNGKQPDSYVTRLTGVVGSRVTRPIGNGQWISRDLLAAVPDVNEGGPVLLVYQTEDVRFTSPGVALVPAKVGQFIPVRNLESGKIVYGVVQHDQLVKVN